jgi:hypothetical protein
VFVDTVLAAAEADGNGAGASNGADALSMSASASHFARLNALPPAALWNCISVTQDVSLNVSNSNEAALIAPRPGVPHPFVPAWSLLRPRLTKTAVLPPAYLPPSVATQANAALDGQGASAATGDSERDRRWAAAAAAGHAATPMKVSGVPDFSWLMQSSVALSLTQSLPSPLAEAALVEALLDALFGYPGRLITARVRESANSRKSASSKITFSHPTTSMFAAWKSFAGSPLAGIALADVEFAVATSPQPRDRIDPSHAALADRCLGAAR